LRIQTIYCISYLVHGGLHVIYQDFQICGSISAIAMMKAFWTVDILQLIGKSFHQARHFQISHRNGMCALARFVIIYPVASDYNVLPPRSQSLHHFSDAQVYLET
jgi:hypothetical protein